MEFVIIVSFVSFGFPGSSLLSDPIHSLEPGLKLLSIIFCAKVLKCQSVSLQIQCLLVIEGDGHTLKIMD